MNKYLGIVLLSIVLLMMGNISAFAQACGGGIFTFEFYTQNLGKIRNINYEILPVNMDSATRINPKWGYSLQHGTIINHEYLGKIIDEKGETELNEILVKLDNQKKGKARRGVISFKTRELAHFPCLLKLSSNKKDIYILADLFGGCDRETRILWNEAPQIVRFD